MHIKQLLHCFVLASAMLLNHGAFAAKSWITVASTTSTENSGLFDSLLPAFSSDHGIEVRVVAVGTGKAIKMAERGDADVLLVHHKPSEDKFVSEGFGVERHDVMYNDFVLVGPSSDPAKISGAETAAVALQLIAAQGALFASRGDDSGTHKKEVSLWRLAGKNSESLSGEWYRETGSGMGATLNVASGLNAYALTDRATWLKFGNKGDLKLLFEDDPPLFNQYGVILVNPEKYPHVKVEEGNTFIRWLVSEKGQQLINSYTIKGNQAFFANAEK